MTIEYRDELVMGSSRPTGAFVIAAPHYIDVNTFDNYLMPESGWGFIFKPFVDDMIQSAKQAGTPQNDNFLSAVSNVKGVDVKSAFCELSAPASDNSIVPNGMPCVRVSFQAMKLLLSYIEESCAQILAEHGEEGASLAFWDRLPDSRRTQEASAVTFVAQSHRTRPSRGMAA